MLSIAELRIHPVKSCAGIRLDAARLTERGLEHDRRWMIVADGVAPARFITQREVPRLALVRTAIVDGGLLLSTEGADPLAVSGMAEGPRRLVTVWRDTIDAIDEGAAAARWVSARVGRPARLVRFPDSQRRPCSPAWAGESGAHTAFADGYPLLVVSRAALDELNNRLAVHGQPGLPMDRFRPNIVVDGAEAHDEDHWQELSGPGYAIRPVKPCVRCPITTTDQLTAEVGTEPLLTLAAYRDDARMGGVTFGMNAIVIGGAGATLRTGDPLDATWAFGD